MHNHDAQKTRITIERISVTTVRSRSGSQPRYCDICRQRIEPDPAEVKPLLLAGKAGEQPAAQINNPDDIEPDLTTDIKGDRTK